MTPEKAAAWAGRWVTKAEEAIDARISRALVELAGADAVKDTEGHYLYGREDFAVWLRELTGESWTPGPSKPPTSDEVAAKLRALIAGEITPGEASDWASPWITRYDEVDVSDDRVRRALDELAGADLIADMDGNYLHGREDFVAWLKRLTGDSG